MGKLVHISTRVPSLRACSHSAELKKAAVKRKLAQPLSGMGRDVRDLSAGLNVRTILRVVEGRQREEKVGGGCREGREGLPESES